MGGDTHILCVACLGKEHAQSALETETEHCDVFPLRMLRSRLALFREDAQARVPQGSGPTAAEAQRVLGSWVLGFANGSVSGGRDEHRLISAEGEDVRSRGKLDERFLPSRAQPQRPGIPFFPDLHTEVSRSWENTVSYRVYSTQTSHYSSILNKKEHGYREMPKVEETVASYLSPEYPHPLNPRHYPLNQWESHQHWLARLIQRLVRQQLVYTLCRCCKPIRLNY